MRYTDRIKILPFQEPVRWHGLIDITLSLPPNLWWLDITSVVTECYVRTARITVTDHVHTRICNSLAWDKALKMIHFFPYIELFRNTVKQIMFDIIFSIASIDSVESTGWITVCGVVCLSAIVCMDFWDLILSSCPFIFKYWRITKKVFLFFLRSYEKVFSKSKYYYQCIQLRRLCLNRFEI